MFNIKQELKGDILILTIDLSKPGHVSKSGKSIVIASSEGNISADGAPDVKIGLNVYKSKS
jgi:hypothetical protein